MSGADEHVRQVLKAASPKGVHIALLQHVVRTLDVPDGQSVVSDFLKGFPLVGDIPIVSVAKDYDVRSPTQSPSELIAKSKDIFLKATRSPKLSDEDIAAYRKVRDKTYEEVRLGRMVEPVRVHDDTVRFISRPVTRRFPVVQTSSSGEQKVRPIEDFLTSQVTSEQLVQCPQENRDG